MLAALARGTSHVTGLLEGEDVLSTACALRLLGASIERLDAGSWRVESPGAAALGEPADMLDLGNAGTGCRLLMGILAGRPFTSFMSGDASLRARPMARVIEPLRRMGVGFVARSGSRLPLALTGRARLEPITHRSAVASAQVKSAILLAGLAGAGDTVVIEPLPSRDHTERMLASMGATIASSPEPGGALVVSIRGGAELTARSFTVPGDPSSAAFLMVAAAIAEGSELRLQGVGTNPMRSGLLETLREMGADITLDRRREQGGEAVADLLVKGGDLRGIEVPPERAPSMIDEYPILAVAATMARGRTVMRGLGELRVKESDRLAAMACGLAACGAKVAVEGDDLIVDGRGSPAGGVTIDARLDHRIAMSFLVLGGIAGKAVTVNGAETIDTSFPGFASLMNRLGGRIARVEARA
jgi:3-phosphoshikimate 1-carboxyvinyltransferase